MLYDAIIEMMNGLFPNLTREKGSCHREAVNIADVVSAKVDNVTLTMSLGVLQKSTDQL
jgi:hypothetical protein